MFFYGIMLLLSEQNFTITKTNIAIYFKKGYIMSHGSPI